MKEGAKPAKKSKFNLHADSGEASGPSAKPITNGSSCPSIEQAISDAKRIRYERRAELQTHLYRVGADVSAPLVIQQTQPESVASQGAAGSSAKPKVLQGTVLFAAAVDVEGKVSDVKVVRALDPVLDKRGTEAVRKWQFSPARMKGLPVPVQIDIEVNFDLH